MTAIDPDLQYRLAALENAVHRLETLLGGSTRMIEGVRFSQGASIAAGHGFLLFPGQAPSYGEGGVYYDSTRRKLRVRGESGWESVLSGDWCKAALASSDLILTTSQTDIPGASLSLGAGTWAIIGVFDIEFTTAAATYAVGRLSVGGVHESNDAILRCASNLERLTAAQVWRVVLNATTTCKLRAAKTNDVGVVKALGTHTTITALGFG